MRLITRPPARLGRAGLKLIRESLSYKEHRSPLSFEGLAEAINNRLSRAAWPLMRLYFARLARSNPFLGRRQKRYLNFELKDRDGTDLGFCRDRHFGVSKSNRSDFEWPRAFGASLTSKFRYARVSCAMNGIVWPERPFLMGRGRSRTSRKGKPAASSFETAPTAPPQDEGTDKALYIFG